jgi:SAM-dependent methyltransferase
MIDNKPKENTGRYWDERYQNNETGWDMHQVSPPLKGYIDSLKNKQLNILIPGCGNAYEAEYLLQQGCKNVSLIDISKILTDRLKEKFKNREIKIYNEDFFNHTGQYDLILEQTFFCALYPELRNDYVDQCERLLCKNGKIAGVLFNKEMKTPGPPFSTTNEEYKKLFSEKFAFNIFEPCTNSIKPRLGSEIFFEFQKIKR